MAPVCELGPLPSLAAEMARGEGAVAIVAARDEWESLAIAAEHSRVAVLKLPDLDTALVRPDLRSILVRNAQAHSANGWRVAAAYRDWTLLVRSSSKPPFAGMR